MPSRIVVFVKDINRGDKLDYTHYQAGYVVDVFPENHPLGKRDWASDRFKAIDSDMTFAEAQGLKEAPEDFGKVAGVHRRKFKLDIDLIAVSKTDLDKALTVTKETLRSVREVQPDQVIV